MGELSYILELLHYDLTVIYAASLSGFSKADDAAFFCLKPFHFLILRQALFRLIHFYATIRNDLRGQLYQSIRTSNGPKATNE